MGSTRTRIQRAALIGAVLAVVLPFAPSSQGAEASLAPNPTGYYTATQDPFRTVSGPAGEAACQVPSPDPRTCLNPAQLTGGTPGYPRKDNYVYVATVGGNEDADGAIGIPLFSVPPGSTIRALTLDFYVENEAAVGTLNFDPDAPHMTFCLIKEGWAGQDAAPMGSRPDTDCETASTPKKVKEEERSETTDEGVPQDVSLVLYTVDLMPMARKWAAGTENNGVMVRPAPDAPAMSQTAIRTPAIAPDGMQLHVTYDAPALTPLPSAPAPIDNAPTFGDTEEPPAEPQPSFETPDEPPSDGGTVTAAEPVATRTGTPWWAYLALPLGLAVLAGLGRGTTGELHDVTQKRSGPVSRLMDRGGHA
jgi:hypothetical protein